VNWYRGDSHVHSVYSDGELTPEELAAAAQAAGLDFIATTEHNTTAAHSAWRELAGDQLLVILGEEVTTRTGHWLALGLRPGQLVDWQYRARDEKIDEQLDRVHEVGGLCVAAHPHAPYPSGVFMYRYQGFDAVEVWNGLWTSDRPWNADNAAALAEWGRALTVGVCEGNWRPAIGNSDTHLTGQIGIPRTVVRAEELSVDAILDGIRSGRSWIAESAEVDLSFTASAGGASAGIGESLQAGNDPVTVRVKAKGVPSGVVTFHTDRGAVHRAPLASEGAGCLDWHTNAEESQFVRVEVRHPDGRMAALTNPILIVG
jgi:hypothetical protein